MSARYWATSFLRSRDWYGILIVAYPDCCPQLSTPSLAALLRHYSGTTQDMLRKDIRSGLDKLAVLYKRMSTLREDSDGEQFRGPPPIKHALEDMCYYDLSED